MEDGRGRIRVILELAMPAIPVNEEVVSLVLARVPVVEDESVP